MESAIPAQLQPRLRLLIPLVVAFAFFLEQLDATIITTAIPQMARGLDETPLRLNLALTSYILSLAVFIPVSGWVADRVGMRRTFCAAIAIFTLGSIACGGATSLATLVASRIFQGFGGAMLTPVGRLILLRSFPRSDLVTAMAYVSIPSVIGPTLGPIAGGAIATYANWRWIFFVNVPFGVLGIILAWRFVQDIERKRPEPFDWPGFAICGLGMALLETGIENLGRPVLSRTAVALLFAGAASLLALYAVYARRRPNAALDVSQLRVRTFSISMFVGGISRVGINAVPFMLPLLFQLGFGLSPIQSGFLTFVGSLGSLAVRTMTGQLLRRLGFARLLTVNTVLAAVATAGFALVDADTPRVLVALYVLLFGTLRATQFTAIQTLTYADIPPEGLSKATSLGGVVQQLAMGFGVSVSATLLGLIAGSESVLHITDFHHAFLAIAAITLVSALGFLRLSAQDGVQVSGYRTAR